MPSIRALLVVLLTAVGSCRADLLAPSTQTLAGRWVRAQQHSPTGQYFRTLEFSVDGQYVLTDALRGIYAQLPADSVGSITREYGTYVLEGDTLRFAQDSLRSWDHLSGAYLYVGPNRGYIEGPPTDPTVELTRTRLTLRYLVNPGNGYMPVTDKYLRDR